MTHATIIELANEFTSSHPGLDINTTHQAFAHDAIHAVTGLGVSLADEELVLNLSNALVGEEVNPTHYDRVALLLEIVLVSGYFEILADALKVQ
jgi:hypothetical protein